MAKGENRNRRKFMNGAMTPSEMHVRYAFGGKRCDGCKTAPGVMRIRVLMPLEEAMNAAPEYMAAIALSNPEKPGQVPTVQLKESAGDAKGKPYFRASQTYWCRDCRKEAQVAAARGAPSWAVVEIDHGHRDTVQVGYGH